MPTRRMGLVILVSAGLGFGTFALASGADRAAVQQVTRPAAVQPASEAPSLATLVLREQAVPQPRGENRDGVTLAVPRIASPRR